jgi:hypothetical protein
MRQEYTLSLPHIEIEDDLRKEDAVVTLGVTFEYFILPLPGHVNEEFEQFGQVRG